MRKSILYIVIIIAALVGIQAEEVKPDAIFTKLRHEYTLNADGSIQYKYEHSLKYLSNYSFSRRHGESFIIYNPDWQELKVTKSQTLMADGKLIKAPFNAFNEVLPRVAANTPGYMNLREMVVTHTGLEKNCEVNFAYEINTKAGFLPGLFGKITIGNHDLVKSMEIVVKVPKGKKLNLFMSNNGPIGDKFEKSEFDIYVWKINNIPIIPVESNQPALEEFLPTLYFSTLSADEIVKELLMSKPDLLKLNQKTIDYTKELLKDKFSFKDKAMALQDFVYNNASSNINLSYIGLKPQTAQTTFDRASGSTLDNAILLVALCNEVGINADLAATTNYSNAKPDITLFSEFNKFVVYCKPENKRELPIILSPNTKQTNLIPNVAHGKSIIVLNKQKLSVIPPIKEDNYLSLYTNLELKGTKLSGKSQIRLQGDYYNNLNIDKYNDKLISNLKNQKWIPDKQKSDASLSGNTMFANFNFENTIDKSETNVSCIKLPKIPKSFSDSHIDLIPVSRVTPLKLDKIYNEEYSYNIKLDGKSKPLFLPININEENKLGKVIIDIREENGFIYLHRKLEFNKKYINPEDYHLLYKMISLWANERHKNLYIN